MFLDPEEFKKSFEKVPRLALDLLIVNKSNQFLLTRRAIEPGKGMWHLPGSFLLKNESIAACLERIAMKELGFTLSAKDCRIAGVSENLETDERGHVIDIIYKYRILKDIWLKPWGDSAEMAFFNELPDGIGFNHGQILSKLFVKNS